MLIYRSSLSSTNQQLVDQYQSAKWGIALSPPGTGSTEVAKATASDGYSAFTTRYLERLSNTADILLQATSSITLDLKGDTLSLANDRNITLQTTNGNISNASAGSIVTNRTGSGGNITFNAGGSGNITLNNALTLTAGNGGQVNFSAGGGVITLGGDLALTANNFNVTGTITGPGTGAFSFKQSTTDKSLAVGTGRSADITLSNAVINGIKTAFASYSFGRTDGGAIINNTASWEDPVTFLSGGDFTNATNSTSDDTFLVRAGGNAVLNGTLSTTSSSANALVLAAGGNFLNYAGSSALSASNSRWLVYSSTPANNRRDGLLPTASDFNKTYAGNAPATIGAGNRLIYATSTQPTLTLRVDDASVEYGDSFSATPTLSYVSGLLGNDTLLNSGLTGTATTSVSYSAGDNAGTRVGALSATLGSLANPLGYTYSLQSGDLVVTKATLDVTAESLSREYGELNPTLTGTVTGFKLSQGLGNLTAAPTYTTAATQSTDVGSYTITAGGGSATNYNFHYINGALNITKATLDVTLQNNAPTRQEGAANPSFDLAYSGFKLMQNVSVIDVAPTVSTAANGASHSGNYAITISGGSDNNYLLHYTNPAGTLQVTSVAPPPPPPPLPPATTTSTTTSPALPSTVEITSQNPIAAVSAISLNNTTAALPATASASATGAAAATNSTSGDAQGESGSTGGEQSNATAEAAPRTGAGKTSILRGLVSIHPSLVRFFNLDADTANF